MKKTSRLFLRHLVIAQSSSSCSILNPSFRLEKRPSFSAFHVGVTASLANNPRFFFFHYPTSQRSSPDSIFSVCIQSIPRIHAPAGNDGERWKKPTPVSMNFRDEMALILVVNMGTSSHNNERTHATIFENKHLVFCLCNAHWLWLLGPLFVPSGVLCCLWTPFIFQIFPNPMGTHKGLEKTAKKKTQVFPQSIHIIESGSTSH